MEALYMMSAATKNAAPIVSAATTSGLLFCLGRESAWKYPLLFSVALVSDSGVSRAEVSFSLFCVSTRLVGVPQAWQNFAESETTSCPQSVQNLFDTICLDYASRARVSTWGDCRFPHARKLAEWRGDGGQDATSTADRTGGYASDEAHPRD